MKKNALQKGLPVPDKAVTQTRVLKTNMKVPDLITLKDFFCFVAVLSKGMIMKQLTVKLLNMFKK